MAEHEDRTTPGQSAHGRAARAARQARSAEALRRNLKRRKQQARERNGVGPGEGSAQHDDEGKGSDAGS
jgi:hypothetical protein